jgi:hypothetical protein
MHLPIISILSSVAFCKSVTMYIYANYYKPTLVLLHAGLPLPFNFFTLSHSVPLPAMMPYRRNTLQYLDNILPFIIDSYGRPGCTKDRRDLTHFMYQFMCQSYLILNFWRLFCRLRFPLPLSSIAGSFTTLVPPL